MITITASDFQKKLESILNEVEGGQTYALTRGGRIFARIMPATSNPAPSAITQSKNAASASVQKPLRKNLKSMRRISDR
jgi:antitoxin (DNA-binding transcriptional repressor) of toxin-antitoxin stability system